MIPNLWGGGFRSSFKRTMNNAMPLSRFVALLLSLGHGVVLIAAEQLEDCSS